MKKHFALLICSLAFAASAASLGTDAVGQAGFGDLTEAQKAEVIKHIADTKARTKEAAAVASQTTPQKVNEWLNIGERIGQGMAGAAREMGVAVNEFASSPVGMWTIALITWKFMGGAVVHIGGALLIWLIGFPLLIWVVRHRRRSTEKYDPEKVDIFKRSRKVSVVHEPMTDDTTFVACFGSVVLLAVGLITMFSF